MFPRQSEIYRYSNLASKWKDLIPHILAVMLDTVRQQNGMVSVQRVLLDELQVDTS